MDTILFFYLKRDLDAPAIEPVGLKRYMLVRVGLNVRQEEWFGLKLGKEGIVSGDNPERGGGAAGAAETETEKETCGAVSGRKMRASGIFFRIGTALAGRRKTRREEAGKRAERLEKERLLQERALWISRTEKALGKLAEELSRLADEPGKCYCVYESGVRKAVIEADDRKDAVLPLLWRKYLEWEEFRGYGRQFWTEQLFSRSVWPHYVILGTAPCVYELIEKYARGMKSLRWILAEADCSQELLDFVEDFYTEYGLAADLQTFESSGSRRRLALSCKEPSNIIDFTEGILFECQGLAAGTVWIDIFSAEEKKHRILARNQGIRYLSMKEEWKRVQRRCRAPHISG